MPPSDLTQGTRKGICICLLCGLPGSGKTTLLRALTNHSDDYSQPKGKKQNIVGIEYDTAIPNNSETADKYDWRKAQEMSGKWKMDRAQVLLAVEAIIQQIMSSHGKDISLMSKPNEVSVEIWQRLSDVRELLNSGQHKYVDETVLVIDDNMYFRSMRYEYYKLAKRYNTGYCQVHVTCHIKTAMKRNQKREAEQQVSDEVILRMVDKLELPDPDKNHWELNSVTVNTDVDIDIHPVLKLIEAAIMNPVQLQDQTNEELQLNSRVGCSASMLHQADLILRKCVSVKMTDCKTSLKPEQLKEISKHVLQAKEKILKDLKDGHHSVTVPEIVNIVDSAQMPDSEFFTIIKDLFLKELSKF